jgi:hypothetical protein
MVGADAGAETDATVWDEDIRCKVGTCALKEVDRPERSGRNGSARRKGGMCEYEMPGGEVYGYRGKEKAEGTSPLKKGDRP